MRLWHFVEFPSDYVSSCSSYDSDVEVLSYLGGSLVSYSIRFGRFKVSYVNLSRKDANPAGLTESFMEKETLCCLTRLMIVAHFFNAWSSMEFLVPKAISTMANVKLCRMPLAV